MDYGKYKQARNASWQCIIDYGINHLPVKINTIIRQSENIKLCKNSLADMLPDGKSGMTIYKNGVFYIIYNDLDSHARCRFSIAHELGHIFLGHVLVDAPEYKIFSCSNDEESAANVFARGLLAPACILHEIGALSADQIKQVCDISYSAASIRVERMAELERRNKYYLSPTERQVREQFLPFIQEIKIL